MLKTKTTKGPQISLYRGVSGSSFLRDARESNAEPEFSIHRLVPSAHLYLPFCMWEMENRPASEDPSSNQIPHFIGKKIDGS